MGPHVRRLAVVLAVLASLPLVAVLAYFFAPATSFSAAALGYSVAGETSGHGLLDSTPCKPWAAAWSCEVWDNAGSAVVTYRVEMDGTRCWRASRLAPRSRLPSEASGCLKLRDQIRLWERVW